MALWTLAKTTRVSWYQKKHSPTHTYRGHQSSLVCFLHLLQSTASSLFNLCAWQSFSTISLQVFFGLPLGLAPIHFFTQSLSSFHSTRPYHHNLLCCSTESAITKKLKWDKWTHLYNVPYVTCQAQAQAQKHMHKRLKQSCKVTVKWLGIKPPKLSYHNTIMLGFFSMSQGCSASSRTAVSQGENRTL